MSISIEIVARPGTSRETVVEEALASSPLLGGVSGGLIVVAKNPIVHAASPKKPDPRGVDFPSARSAEQLAKSFEAFFQPSTDLSPMGLIARHAMELELPGD